MPSRIEDYALIGDCETAALVAKDGSIDWLCLPSFDAGACFAALLGTPDNGRWQIAPQGEVRQVRRRYRPGTLILETEWHTDSGVVTLIDCMPACDQRHDVLRIVSGVTGQVPMTMDLTVRFDYGSIVPWVRRAEDGLHAVAGPNALHLRTPIDVRGEDLRSVAQFTVAAGQRVPFLLTWHPSHRDVPPAHDPEPCLTATEKWWQEWSQRCTYQGPKPDLVQRSLITLKALTFAPTGGLVAAPTTSLPEQIGSVRNWDYRFCWLRDATFTLYALMVGGYLDEARSWRNWLERAIAGLPSEMQIMYGLRGERRLVEMELPWLTGYEGSHPVRIGNAASNQHQLDVYGEIMDALFIASTLGLEPSENAWRIQKSLMEFLETDWLKPDEGIWEVRGPRRHFTHSKVMAWVAADRAVKSVERFGLTGPADKWRQLRGAMHEQICREGFDPKLNAFVQSYGAKRLDASLLMIPLVGFLPPEDPRVKGTVAAIERDLLHDGFVHRYATDPAVDGLPAGEGVFLMCSFWLADNLALQGRYDDARRLFDQLTGLCNDVGLLSEEYDPSSKRLLGNFPQALSHIGLINTARNLSRQGGPAHHRPAQ